MLDLSNNNGPADFRRVHQAGQRRVYLKVTESVGFVDRTYADRRAQAQRAGLKTGGYHFAHGIASAHSPREEADHFLRSLGTLRPGKDLRPCLDLEYKSASRAIGAWASEWLAIVQRELGVRPLIYSYGDYLQRCQFPTPPAFLWLASYGRNDGREHPFVIPRPWTRIVAHQYSSNARVAGIAGPVDISHVFNYPALELAAPRRRS